MRILALTTSYPSMEGEAGGNFIRSLVLALKRRTAAPDEESACYSKR